MIEMPIRNGGGVSASVVRVLTLGIIVQMVLISQPIRAEVDWDSLMFSVRVEGDSCVFDVVAGLS